jgi:ligand-binding sensor domain-containing protein
VWVSGGGGVARRDLEGEWTLWDYLVLPSYSVYGGVEGSDGVIYFGTEAGLLSFAGDDYTAWTAPNVPVNAAFAHVLPEPAASRLWFVEEYGVTTDIYEPANEAWLAGPELNCESCAPLAWDEAGQLWAASELGLWIFDGEDEEIPYTAEQGLPSTEVRAVAIGPNGTAWIATLGGLAFYDNGEITEVYDAASSGLASDAVHKLLLASDQSLWAVTDANLSRRLPDGTWVHYGQDDPFITDLYINDLVEDASGDIWAATQGDGVYRYRAAEQTWERYSPSLPGVDLPWTEINCVAAAPDGTVWVGAPYAGAARFDGEHWEVIEVGEGLIHSNVNDIYVDPDGVVWFATSGGVTRYAP